MSGGDGAEPRTLSMVLSTWVNTGRVGFAGYILVLTYEPKGRDPMYNIVHLTGNLRTCQLGLQQSQAPPF